MKCREVYEEIELWGGGGMRWLVHEWKCDKRVCGCFFFKQKTAYEMLRSLVGSEMCIRDRVVRSQMHRRRRNQSHRLGCRSTLAPRSRSLSIVCLLYTSDAADDLLCVDLGGRRIITKKTSCNIICI